MRIRRLALAFVLTGSMASGAAGGVRPDDVGGAGVFTCRATINLAAGFGTTTCIGLVIGEFGTPSPSLHSRRDPGTHVMAASVTYVETGCPLIGQADGIVDVDGQYYSNIAYVRVGGVALTVLSGLHTGMATALFTVLPGDLAPDVCSDTNVEIELEGSFGAL